MRQAVYTGVCGLLLHLVIPRRHILVSFLVQCILLALAIRIHIRPVRAVVYCCVGFATILPTMLCLSYSRMPVNAIPACGHLGIVLSCVYERMNTVFNKKQDDYGDVINL